MAGVKMVSIPANILIEVRAYLANQNQPIAAILADTIDHYLSEAQPIDPQQAVVLGDK